MSDIGDYRIMSKLGEGTFSEVIKAKNKKSGKYLALKRFKKNFKSADEIEGLREIQALKRLNPHPNIVLLEDIIFDGKHGVLSLAFELMDANLYEVLSKKGCPPIQDQKAKWAMWQILKALDFVHSKGIFHRDIKPENILVRGDISSIQLPFPHPSVANNPFAAYPLVKLADFGSCRGIYSKMPFTEYIATRWYRSPECLLFDGIYNFKMDVWGVGCVLFELVTKIPLFPGDNEVDQLHRIHSVLGTPSEKILKAMVISGTQAVGSNGKSGVSSIFKKQFSFPPTKGCGLRSSFPPHVLFGAHRSHGIGPNGKVLTVEDYPGISEECVHLIELLLQYDPETRLTTRQALKHPWLKECREAEIRLSQLHHQQQQQQQSTSAQPQATQSTTQPSVDAKATINANTLPRINKQSNVTTQPSISVQQQQAQKQQNLSSFTSTSVQNPTAISSLENTRRVKNQEKPPAIGGIDTTALLQKNQEATSPTKNNSGSIVNLASLKKELKIGAVASNSSLAEALVSPKSKPKQAQPPPLQPLQQSPTKPKNALPNTNPAMQSPPISTITSSFSTNSAAAANTTVISPKAAVQILPSIPLQQPSQIDNDHSVLQQKVAPAAESSKQEPVLENETSQPVQPIQQPKVEETVPKTQEVIAEEKKEVAPVERKSAPVESRKASATPKRVPETIQQILQTSLNALNKLRKSASSLNNTAESSQEKPKEPAVEKQPAKEEAQEPSAQVPKDVPKEEAFRELQQVDSQPPNLTSTNDSNTTEQMEVVTPVSAKIDDDEVLIAQKIAETVKRKSEDPVTVTTMPTESLKISEEEKMYAAMSAVELTSATTENKPKQEIVSGQTSNELQANLTELTGTIQLNEIK